MTKKAKKKVPVINKRGKLPHIAPNAEPVPLSVDELLIAQIGRLIQATAEQVHKDDALATKYEAHLYRLIGVNCTAKARLFDSLGGSMAKLKIKEARRA